MAKFYGIVGFFDEYESSDGIWEEQFLERIYTGDIIKNSRQWSASESINDNFRVNNIVSIISDDYALENLFAIRYVKWMGVAWRVTTVDVELPRLNLTLGEVFNGDQT